MYLNLEESQREDKNKSLVFLEKIVEMRSCIGKYICILRNWVIPSFLARNKKYFKCKSRR